MFLETCLFLLGCPVCWDRVVHIILFFFLFLWYQLLFLLFHFLLICILFLFLVSLPSDLSSLFTLSKNQLFYFILLCLTSVLFIFSLIFIISFLMLTLDFVCSFSDSYRCQVKVLIWDFFLFSFLYSNELSTKNFFWYPIDFIWLCFHCPLFQVFFFNFLFMTAPVAYERSRG